MVRVAKRKLKSEETAETTKTATSDLGIGKKPAKLAKKSKDIEEPAEATASPASASKTVKKPLKQPRKREESPEAADPLSSTSKFAKRPRLPRKSEESADATNLRTSTSKILKKPSRFPRKSDGKDQDAPSCAVKLGHIPYGFFEEEMLKYFTQFGKVRRVRVARNKKTGNHKGWAYVEFTSPEVAQIAAETMNGYLMFEKRLYCKVLKKREIPKCLLKGKVILRRPAKYATSRRHTKIASAPKTEEQLTAAETRLHSGLKKKKKQLAALGLDYNFEIEPTKTAKVQKSGS